MSDTDTTVEVLDPADTAADPFGLTAMLGGLDMGAMLAGLGIPMPDPDAADLDDVDGSLDELHAKVDWLAAVVLALVVKIPSRFRPDTFPEYPSE